MQNKITQKHLLIMLILFLLSLAFYWYEWRPIKINKECVKSFQEIVKKNNNIDFNLENINAFRFYYDFCLWGKGLKK